MGNCVNIENRSSVRLSEISEVLEFGDDFVSAQSSNGKIEIEGGGMKIVSMSAESGELLISGRIDGVYYLSKPSKKKGFFSKNG